MDDVFFFTREERERERQEFIPRTKNETSQRPSLRYEREESGTRSRLLLGRSKTLRSPYAFVFCFFLHIVSISSFERGYLSNRHHRRFGFVRSHGCTYKISYAILSIREIGNRKRETRSLRFQSQRTRSFPLPGGYEANDASFIPS